MSIIESLKPYKSLIGSAASTVTIGQFFSGIFICNDIRKKGTTSNISSIPFVGGVAVGMGMLKYAQLLDDPAMLRVNSAAIILNSLYCIFYYFYSEDKWEEILKQATAAGAVVAILLGYCDWEDPELLEDRYGMIMTVLMLLLNGSPLINIGTILDTKDASTIPFVLTLTCSIGSFLWLLYSFVIENAFMIVQNIAGFLLSVSQLILIYLYPGSGKHKLTEPNS